MQMLSVVIITYNEQNNIGRCIDSVAKIADEVVVLDSFSTDQTVAIATAKGAVVYQEAFAGYIEQKNRAMSLASNDFVLSLDADEAIDETLEEAILAIRRSPNSKGYTMNRCTNYCGRFIRHGSWYPDRKLRLFDRNVVKWGGDNPHDRAEFTGQFATGHLRGDILHYSYHSLEEHVAQNNKFSTISAAVLFSRGKKAGWFKILVNPSWAFLQAYVIRGGFRDGFYGFVIAINVAHLTFFEIH